jgi:hypothetical protein
MVGAREGSRAARPRQGPARRLGFKPLGLLAIAQVGQRTRNVHRLAPPGCVWGYAPFALQEV